MNIGRRDGSDAESTLKGREANLKRSTVSFEDVPPRGRERVKNDADDEEKRNERRRSEAKSAIEVCVLFVIIIRRPEFLVVVRENCQWSWTHRA